MTGKFTFAKNEKLCYKKHIDRLFSEGKSFTLKPLKVFYLIPEIPEESTARVLIAIPRKKFKRAVDRNRLRRLIREAYRLNRHRFLLRKHTHIGIVYIGNTVHIPYTEMESILTGCLDRLAHLVNEAV